MYPFGFRVSLPNEKVLPHLCSSGLYLIGRANVFTYCVHTWNVAFVCFPVLDYLKEFLLITDLLSASQVGAQLILMVFLGVDSIFSNEGRLGHWSEAISTVKVGEPGVKPGHLTTSFGLSLGKKSCCCPCFNSGLMPSPQILLASLVNPWFKVPSGNHRIFTLECKNPRNHHSLRKCVLIRFILVCECSCTLPLQYIFTTGFIKNDSARQMAPFRRKEWLL